MPHALRCLSSRVQHPPGTNVPDPGVLATNSLRPLGKALNRTITGGLRVSMLGEKASSLDSGALLADPTKPSGVCWSNIEL